MCKLRDGAEFHEAARIHMVKGDQKNAKISIEGAEAKRIFGINQMEDVVGTEFWLKNVDDDKGALFGPFKIANVDTKTLFVFDFKPPAPNTFTDWVSFSLF